MVPISSSPMNVFILGGSRNIGYHSAVRLLEKGHKVTFLLRRVSTFDEDTTIQNYIQKGTVKIAAGDALKEDDVRNGWTIAGQFGPVDVVLFTVGGREASFSMAKGSIVLKPHNLVTVATANLLSTYPRSPSTQPPKLIICTSNGLTPPSHRLIPFALKPVFGVLIAGPHEDKLGVERLVHHAAGWSWNPASNGSVLPNVLPIGWDDSESSGGWLKDALIVRPALLTDGECKSDKKGSVAYRTAEDSAKGVWTVSRKDVAYFIVEQAIAEWKEWNGKRVVVYN